MPRYRPSFDAGEYRCRGAHFRLDTERGPLLYTYIRKNASTAFKMHLSSDPPLLVRLRRRFIAKNYYRLADMKHRRIAPSDNRDGLAGGLFVYRDPMERIVSFYLNKFVQPLVRGYRPGGEGLIRGKRAADARFSDLLTYLEAPFDDLDVHCIPQKAHLLEMDYTHPVRIDRLEQVMAELIGPDAAAAGFGKKWNASGRAGETVEDDLTDRTAEDLATSGLKLRPANFLGPDARAFLAERYAEDMEMVAEIEGTEAHTPPSATA
ncbi:sulfotransferase family protein [Vannielia litorea]|uniref:sulfotransferase family 2 domain-containing protein n=1 Tax=Vannielia litorea TaxID=1217970 RepID=UPI001C987090|nr:sulfotransferase family 2 domain-containing protein [Vannielia litorea]MBY6153578.1 sulfotransferase family protein [Vannielia litorea]